MSETISQLPTATQANATDLIPATQASIGPGTGTTRTVTQAQLIAVGGTVTSNITLDAGGGWSSSNVGKQLLVTTPAAASNPGIGITDSNGANLWGVWNHAGVLTMSVMPAYSDNATGPTNIVSVSSAGLAVTGTLSSSGALTVSTAGTSGNQAVNFSQFNPTVSGNGFTKLPGGLLLQWGSLFNAAQDFTVTFPTGFPTACFSVTLVVINATFTTNNAVAYSSLTQFSYAAHTVGGVTISWMAIGS